MELAKAKAIAEELIERLRPGCTRIELAGSIRRGKDEVKDIELVAMPDTSKRRRPQMGRPAYKTLLDALLADLLASGRAERVKGGDRYKQFRIIAGEDLTINLDLFLVLESEKWGYQFTIRTGPAEFSHWLVTPRAKGGALPAHLKEADSQLWDAKTGEPLSTPDEESFLRALGLEWIAPDKREPHWGLFREKESRSVAPSQIAMPAQAQSLEQLPEVAEWLRDFPPALHITGREMLV